MFRSLEPTLEEVIIRCQAGTAHQVRHRVSRLLGDLELDRPLGFLLEYNPAMAHAATMGNVSNPDFDQITSSQLTVDGQVEQSQITMAVGQLKPNSDGPDLLELERRPVSQAFEPKDEQRQSPQGSLFLA